MGMFPSFRISLILREELSGAQKVYYIHYSSPAISVRSGSKHLFLLLGNDRLSLALYLKKCRLVVLR